MEKYFVPVEIALLLQINGFDEPCLFFYDKTNLEQVQDTDQFRRIGYQTVRNSELSHARFTAAPLYDQVFDWLESKDIRIHDYWLPKERLYGVNVFNRSTGKHLWPPVNLFQTVLQGFKAEYLYLNKREAWSAAIIEALKLIDGKTKETTDNGPADRTGL